MQKKEQPEYEEPPTRKTRPCSWKFKKFMAYYWRGLAAIIIPLLLLPIALVEPTKAMRCAYLIVLIVVFWVTSIIPYAVTAMFPIILLPLFNIVDSGTVGSKYFSNVAALLLLSNLISKSIEQSNLHKRLAIVVLSLVGYGPKVIHVFLLSITMAISMFLPNIATSAIFFPIIRAVLAELESNDILKMTKDPEGEGEDPHPTNEALAFYLGVAYAANIGGIATLNGSGIAVTFTHMWGGFYPTVELNYGYYFLLCFPLTIFLGITVTLYLQIVLLGLWRTKNKFKTIEKAARTEIIKAERETLGRITYYEVAVIIGILLEMSLLFFRNPPGFVGYAAVLNTKR